MDALRGIALAAMFAYHFLFDLVLFGVLRQNPYEDARWIAARTAILSVFLMLVGVSLYLAHSHRVRWAPFTRRLAQVGVAALLVSAGSYLVFPQSWIYFGVLHFIAAASVLGLAFLRAGAVNLWLAAALIAIGIAVRVPAFDSPSFSWIGLMTVKPATEDYVPLLPWFGAVLAGIYAGERFKAGALPKLHAWRPRSTAARLLAWAGRHALFLYLAHQPVFLGMLYLALRV